MIRLHLLIDHDHLPIITEHDECHALPVLHVHEAAVLQLKEHILRADHKFPLANKQGHVVAGIDRTEANERISLILVEVPTRLNMPEVGQAMEERVIHLLLVLIHFQDARAVHFQQVYQRNSSF